MTNLNSVSCASEEAKSFLLRSIQDRYSYEFEWLSRPIIQYPQDIVAFQELVSSVKPELIILKLVLRTAAHSFFQLHFCACLM